MAIEWEDQLLFYAEPRMILKDMRGTSGQWVLCMFDTETSMLALWSDPVRSNTNETCFVLRNFPRQVFDVIAAQGYVSKVPRFEV